jgi:hypothetical protein
VLETLEAVDSDSGGAFVETPAGRLDRYGVALGLLAITIGLQFIVVPGTWTSVLSIVLGAATLLFVMTASDAPRPLVVVSRLIAVGAVISAVGLGLTGVAIPDGVVPAAGAALAFLAPIPIARRLLRQPAITIHTVAGALCLYLLAGLCFAHLYLVVDELGGPAFVQLTDPSLADAVYYSFVVIATLGFGDITPAADAARLLTVGEAIGGQLYLVTIIALLVANLGRDRRRR